MWNRSKDDVLCFRDKSGKLLGSTYKVCHPKTKVPTDMAIVYGTYPNTVTCLGFYDSVKKCKKAIQNYYLAPSKASAP